MCYSFPSFPLLEFEFMSRLIFFIAIGAVIYFLLRSYRKNSPPPPSSAPPLAEDMVRCAQCGVHLPKSESVQVQQLNFCCAAHRDAYQK